MKAFNADGFLDAELFLDDDEIKEEEKEPAAREAGRPLEGILWATVLELSCGKCKQQARWRGRSREAVIKVAQLAGWMFLGGMVRCSEHSGLPVRWFRDQGKRQPVMVPRPPIRELVAEAIKPQEIPATEQPEKPKRKRRAIVNPPHCTYKDCYEPVAPAEEGRKGSGRLTRCVKHLAEGRQWVAKQRLKKAAAAAGIALTPDLISLQLRRIQNGEQPFTAEELAQGSEGGYRLSPGGL